MKEKKSASKIERRWKNRIVGSGEAPASWFLANEANWRVHPKPQQEAVEGLLDEVGWVQNVIVNKRTSKEWGRDRGIETMVDGHMRVGRALSSSEDEPIPYVYVDLSPDEERKILAMMDPIGRLSVDDNEKLSALIGQITVENEALKNLLESPGMNQGKKKEVPAEVPFSQEIGEENNYIVLLFNRDIDWQAAEQHFNLQRAASKGSNGSKRACGIGRVVDGAKYLGALLAK